ncbi:MAG: thioredoxin [Candidatus Jacksonbacteria bacterium RIFOXYC2_FULL_44_29]|nr:MAG: Thioredoxin [Parcubacteria group bacterium GW2011_GWC2_44_22]OGY76009.1 MAG: thioredoxin [Candidatus Jacksonbacteria bacterium RIFOXYA2_FULL_43_12]OGY76775.1 MAG: thioredoxin [Candidatus Jacksonbacteria bacterium RIFOXYB2_FULL_44_15]OGY79182.1 MAG: thioredoxin [Candidatus Jacksonbacteria bacterium RIFOXYC2_FULL_44_29]OGY82099.1 MAG: thioredoxin [Candidatus Jacksonbacteria bacterium RIFOXYD2_FULL_43_21]HBH46883.1 thioredoxin [Candidatus Jacksonbacteria bacterium]
MAQVIELKAVDFDKEVLQSKVPVLVDFWATWCGPCRMQGPIIEALAAELGDDKAKIAKLNIDEAASVAQNFGIVSIPTIILFNKGEERERLSGLQSKDNLLDKLDKYIK